ncbi:hypothetical protein COK07_27420, partial [Bacillus thuringiensis]|uniref:hypothetical protein n=1 Tax=Bacillus thuringiensis TaxID=1428 RepID=UPI000BF4872B
FQQDSYINNYNINSYFDPNFHRREPLYIPKKPPTGFGLASTGSIFNVYNNCPSKWLYVWLTRVPQGQPTEFWINISQLDTTSISGKRIYYIQNKKHTDFISIDIANITQAVCYNPSLDQGSTGSGSTNCASGGPGKKITSGSFNIEVFKINYEVHECEIRITPSAFGQSLGKQVLNRRQNSIKYSADHGTHKYELILEIKGKALYASVPIFVRNPLTGKWNLLRRIGPSKIGSWNSLKF